MSESAPGTQNTNVAAGLPPAPEERPVETIAYRPVSAWAVAGLGTSGLFAILVIATTLVGIFQAAPVFFPAWLLILAVAGGVLSFVGYTHVQNSEGTRTGARLAQIGIWLSILSGLSYFSYYFVTGLALQSQANDFLLEKAADSGFFPLLREAGDDPVPLTKAFLLTRPGNARAGNPADPKSMLLNYDLPEKESGKGQLSNFKDSFIPRALFKKLGAEATIEPLDVQDWKFEQGSYKVQRNYLIKTKEIHLEMLLTVASTEAETAGQGRKWFLNLRESGPINKTLTPLGESVARLRGNAREWTEQTWLKRLNDGAALDDIGLLDQTAWNNLFLNEKEADKFRQQVHELFKSTEKDRLRGLSILTRPVDFGFWEQTDGKVRMYLHFRLTLAREGSPMGRTADGFFVLETRQAFDPASFEVGARPPEWSLINITFTNAMPPPEGKGPPPL
jgi:hypothetical protein